MVQSLISNGYELNFTTFYIEVKKVQQTPRTVYMEYKLSLSFFLLYISTIIPTSSPTFMLVKMKWIVICYAMKSNQQSKKKIVNVKCNTNHISQKCIFGCFMLLILYLPFFFSCKLNKIRFSNSDKTFCVYYWKRK